MGGVRQVSLDPLRTKRVFECLYYHGKDLCVGCREMLCSTLSHRSEVTETCPGRENQQILLTYAYWLLPISAFFSRFESKIKTQNAEINLPVRHILLISLF